MDDDHISRHEHEEFRRSIEAEYKRMEDENERQNHRLSALEDITRQIASIATSVEKLAMSMENMQKEQISQGKRLETLESRDGEKWRDAIKCIASGVIGIVVGYIFKQMGIF